MKAAANPIFMSHTNTRETIRKEIEIIQMYLLRNIINRGTCMCANPIEITTK